MRFHLNKIDWKRSSEDRRLKFNIGLAVVLIIFFAFFIDIIFSIYKFKGYIEERPKEKKVQKEEVKKEKPKKALILKKLFAKVKIAIILDDAGGKIPDYKKIFSIGEKITISVLPCLSTSADVAKDAKKAGLEVMLHMPMEPENGSLVRHNSGMILCSASDEAIKRTTLNDMGWVSAAKGFNNHEGSKATKDERVMKAVFEAIKSKNIYFIDSRTSSNSLAFRTAKEMHVRSADNDIFLDGGTNEADIESKFRQLISIGKTRGKAIGIGHATRPSTINVLKRLMPEYAKSGVQFVYASEIAK